MSLLRFWTLLLHDYLPKRFFLEEKNQNTENGNSNGFFTCMRLMTSFLKHHQQSTDYTIKRQQRRNDTKNKNIII